jgi:hypothetical protein
MDGCAAALICRMGTVTATVGSNIFDAVVFVQRGLLGKSAEFIAVAPYLI